MKYSALLFASFLAGCSPEVEAGPSPQTDGASKQNLTGELPAQVVLACAGSAGQRQYRVNFSGNYWDFKSIGAWSDYHPIDAIGEDMVILAYGPSHPSGHWSVKLDRRNLTLVEIQTSDGAIHQRRRGVFECEVA